MSTFVSLKVVEISKFWQRLYYHHTLNNGGKTSARNVAKKKKKKRNASDNSYSKTRFVLCQSSEIVS